MTRPEQLSPHPHRTTLICRAPHPGRDKPQFRHRTFHGAFIQILPYQLEPTGRVLERWEDVDLERGAIGVQCWHKDCRRITEYRRVEGVRARAS